MDVPAGTGRAGDEGEYLMIRRITALADRLVAAVAPKVTAHAAACHEIACWCSGIWLFQKRCCDFQPCGPCRQTTPAC